MGYSHDSLRASNNIFYVQSNHLVFLSRLAYQHSQNDVYKQSQPHRSVIYHDARPTMIDAQLTPIVMMWQGEFRLLCFLFRRPILRLWLSATYHPADYPRYMSNNCWRSIDAHFQDGVGPVSLFVANIKAANTLKKDSDVTIISILLLTVAYLNATNDRKTQNTEPEIQTDGSIKTLQDQQVEGFGSMFGPPSGSTLGFWSGPEQHRPVFVVQTRTAGRLPGPVANTSCWRRSFSSHLIHSLE